MVNTGDASKHPTMQSPMTKNDPAQNDNNVEVEKLCSGAMEPFVWKGERTQGSSPGEAAICGSWLGGQRKSPSALVCSSQNLRIVGAVALGPSMDSN